MVLRGQFLERQTLIPSGDVTLEALTHRGDRAPPLLVCPPTPEEGGNMDFAVAGEIVFAASRAGHPTLRFNARGVGASQGTRGGEAEELADARAAAEAVTANVASETFAVCSFGRAIRTAITLAGALAETKKPRVEMVIAVSPQALDLDRCRQLRVPILFIVGGLDSSMDRLALALHCQGTGDRLAVIDQSDRVFSRGLPEVGKAVVEFMALRGIG
jgi:alpha/beta superfamily hydrolase